MVGRNGAGKSTLLKIIAGIQRPSEGSVGLPKEAQVGYLPQEMEHNEEATILEEAMSAFAETQRLEERVEELSNELTNRTDYESLEYSRIIEELTAANERIDLLGGASQEEQVQRILQGLGFLAKDMARTMSEFSGGWKMRVELAKLLLRSPDSSSSTSRRTTWTSRASSGWSNFCCKLKRHPLISHDRAFLDNLTTRTIEVTPIKLFDHKASYTKYQVWREDERTRQEQAYESAEVH